MANKDTLTMMQQAGKLLCATAGALSLVACGTTPLFKIDYHDSRPPLTGPAAVEQTRAAQGTVPMVANDGSGIYTQPQGRGPLQRMPDAPSANTPDGYIVARYSVPNTSLSIDVAARGNETFACAPGDQVIRVNTKPNAWVSMNAEKTQCVALAQDQSSTVRYDMIKLPYNAVPVVNGGPSNPYGAVDGVQYLVNQRTYNNDVYRGRAESLPLAILPDGRSCGQAIPVSVPENPGRFVGKSATRCLTISRGGAQMTEPR